MRLRSFFVPGTYHTGLGQVLSSGMKLKISLLCAVLSLSAPAEAVRGAENLKLLSPFDLCGASSAYVELDGTVDINLSIIVEEALQEEAKLLEFVPKPKAGCSLSSTFVAVAATTRNAGENDSYAFSSHLNMNLSTLKTSVGSFKYVSVYQTTETISKAATQKELIEGLTKAAKLSLRTLITDWRK